MMSTWYEIVGNQHRNKLAFIYIGNRDSIRVAAYKLVYKEAPVEVDTWVLGRNVESIEIWKKKMVAAFEDVL